MYTVLSWCVFVAVGGPVALAFLQQQQQQWKDAHIASLTAFSPPFGGSTDTIKSIISGNNLGISVVSHAIFWPIQSTCASGVWLLPVPTASDGGGWSDDEVVLSDASHVYTARNVTLAFANRGLQQAVDIDAAGVRNISLRNFDAPGVAVNVLRGTGVKTEVGYEYAGSFSSFAPNTPMKPPAVVRWGDGDGTVPNRSLARAERWDQEQQQSVRFRVFEGATHIGILSNKDALGELVHFLEEP